MIKRAEYDIISYKYFIRGRVLDNISVKLPKLEQIPIKLRDLYERYGYTKYRMAKFEPYDFYREHKGFLKSEGILTFNGPKGKLLALKPDVTMSIVKSVKKDKEYKFFYVENVYRTDGGEYNEINQIGLEYVGGESEYASAEVILLARETLKVISDKFVLNIGHAGVWNTCFSVLNLSENVRKELLSKIKSKSVHEIVAVCEKAGIDSKGVELIVKLATLSDKLCIASEKLADITKGLPFGDICRELKNLGEALTAVGADGECFLDLSVMGDITYYNGIIFQGYVESVAKVILAGGRYDNLLKSLDKDHKAIGFAVYTEELERAFREDSVKDDVTVSLTGKSVKDALLEVKTKADAGLRVRAVSEVENA